jgi:hypothetical protein
VDLSAYAGQAVQLAFHMVFAQTPYNGGAFNTSPGWYIDDVALVTGPPVFNRTEGFENGIGDWYADSGIWQVGVPTSGPGSARTGTNCAATILSGNYPMPPFSYAPGPNSRLISPPFLVPPALGNPNLRFSHWYCFACSGHSGSGCDYGVVEIRPMGSNDWTAISSTYSGCPGGWTRPLCDLTSYGGQTVQLAFHMVFGQSPYNGDAFNTAAGWYVDDVVVASPPPPPPQILDPPQDQIGCLGHSATFAVSATGDPPLGYQWYFNTNTLLVNATNASLTLTNLQGTNAGKYSVVVSNPGGSTNSPMAQLTIFDPYTELEVEWYFDAYLCAGLYVGGQSGATYIVKYTDDLRNTNWATWTPLATNTIGSSGWWFCVDETSAFSPMRFYLAKRKP